MRTSGRYTSLPRSPDGNNRRQMTHRTSGQGRPKRRRSRSHDRARALHSRDKSESQTLPSSSEPPSLSPHPQIAKGKGKAVDLARVANDLGPYTNGTEAERVAIDKPVAHVRIHGFPNVEHTVFGDSKPRNRDRVPKALTLRQSVQAHLSLPKTKPLKVSSLPEEPEHKSAGPSLRHGRLPLLQRISGMQEVLNSQPVSISAARPDISALPYPSPPIPPAAIRPQRSTEASGNIDPTEEGTNEIDNQCPNIILNITHDNYVTAHADRSDRAPQVDTDDESTRVRLAELKDMMVASIPPTAPTSPPIPPVPSTPAEPGESTPPAPVAGNPRSKLLERLDSERKRAIGAASGELEVKPVAGTTGEDSLRAELKARNRLRARLAVAMGDHHVDILEP